MTDRPRLLWHSNSPTAPTGYGVQTALFCPLLNEDYEVAISCFYGLEGSRAAWHGMPLLPGLGGNFGAEYMPVHAAEWGGGDPRNTLTFTLMDVWVLPPALMEQLGGNLICWVPVDHDPAPPAVLNFLKDSGATPIAMSRFGQEALSSVKALYCPHGVDTEAYKPVPQAEARERVGAPADAFLVGMIAANKGRPSRKGFQYAFEAFRKFLDKHENSYLYLHTSLKHEWMQGEDLMSLAEYLGIPAQPGDPNARILWADQYRLHFDPHRPSQLAQIISTFDVLLNPCMGGGFEIAQLEAAACGIPSITTDFTAMPESAGPTPWKVGGKEFWTGQNSMNLMADPGELLAALEECHAMPAKQRRALSRRLRRHAEKYDAPRVYEEHMLPSIKKAEKRIHNRSVSFDVTEGLEDRFEERTTAADGPSISVVTPWFEHPELAEAYWKALAEEKLHEVVIVDNGSEERPVLDTEQKATMVRLDENTGFCHANNLGMERASGDAILFLNNDIALGIPGWLEAIRSELKPGVLVGANVRVDEHTQVDGEVHPYLDGWCIAGMKQDLEKLGGWDEDYDEPAYYSDNDLCLRAERAGMSFVAVNPPLTHLLNRTAGPPVGHVQEVTRKNFHRFEAKVREQEQVAA